MSNKPDIKSREEIKILVDSFYKKVLEDNIIKHFFIDVVDVNWGKHMPTMYDFWESTLLNSRSYSGNPMSAHLKLNDKHKMTKVHFDQWLELFIDTIDENFEGNIAEQAKIRAQSIAVVIQSKIYQSGKP